jgi:GT2 family glycosyltransferase
VLETPNLGFAGGANVGVSALRSADVVVLLNPDAVAEPGCIDALRAVAAAEPAWGAWQALVTLPGGDVVNTDGNPVHFLGIAWAGNHGRPVADEGGRREVPSASGAAMAVRRDAWEAVGGFDARYFLYGEDVDLSLRLQLVGWRVGVEPRARVVHDYAFEKGHYKWFHLERNRWWTLLAVYPAPLLVLLSPALLAFEAGLLAVAARGGWLRPKRAAMGAVLRSLPQVRARRRTVQATRQVTAAQFADVLTARLDSELLGAPGRSRIVQAVLDAWWALVRRGLAGR